MSRAWLSLGSNLGDRLARLQFAVRSLQATPGITVTAQSAVYRTAPWGGVAQEEFFNAALAVETALTPRQLLTRCLEIEAAAGRVRGGERWGARSLDIDLLLYDDQRIDEDGLRVPHPYLHQRRFVLQPLYEIAGKIEIPGQGSLDRLLRQCRDQLQVELLYTAQEW